MTRTTPHILVALALIAAVVPATVALAATDTAIVAEEPYEGDAYAAWEIEAQAGDAFEFQGTTFSENASMESVGVWFLDEDLNIEYAAILVHFYGPGTIASLAAGPAGNIASVTDGGSTGGGFLGITTFEAPEDGTYHAVAIGAADGGNEGTLTIEGPESATVTGTSTGDAFLAKPPSFDGTGASLAAETPQPNYFGTQARVLMDATYPVNVDGHLFALFSGNTNTGDLEMSVDTPDGTLDESHSYFLHGEDAGEYVFRVDENKDTWDTEGLCEEYSDDICTQPTIYALGADVAIP